MSVSRTKYQCSKMHSAESLALRISIVLGMVAAVVTILYFAPLPQPHIKSCDRPCHEYDWPMICRYQLVLENYQTLDSSCQECSSNSTLCDEICLVTDGNKRSVFTINRQLPGPSIQVCKNDIIVVDVVNKLPGHGITIHWKGQTHLEAPFMDGVPMISQCPITSFTTFQYKFRAADAGTHFYHAYSGYETENGLFGALVVREPSRLDPLKKLYDVDDRNHIIIITEWGKTMSSDSLQDNNEPRSILINGKGPEANSLTAFRVRNGKRYRFRVIYSGGVSDCAVSLEIEDHLLKVVAVDGNPTAAYETSSIILGKGERVDFVLKNFNFDKSEYSLLARSRCNEKVQGRGVIRYSDAINTFSGSISDEEKNSRRIFDTGLCDSNIGHVCIGDVRSLQKMPKDLRNEKVDKRIFMSFDYRSLANIYDMEEVSSNPKKVYRMNNITFTFPSSPLQTQLYDIPPQFLCSSLKKPTYCNNEEVCECVHVVDLSFGETVEIILNDQGGDSQENIFHLHGHSFYLVAARKLDASMKLNELKNLEEKGLLFKRNLMNPVLKDTVRIPKYGVVALRFIADNPGFWMLRDENSKMWTRGMDVIFKVGDTSNFASAPSNFPSCGSWVGPEFFLA